MFNSFSKARVLIVIFGLMCAAPTMILAAPKSKALKTLNESFLTAVKQGNLNKAKFFVAQGADVNAKNINGNTALKLAVQNEQVVLVEFLLNKGVRVNDKNSDGETALFPAATLGNLKIAKLLINKKININARAKDGTTALIGAVFGEYMRTVTAKAGSTALGKPGAGIPMIKFLISKGANVNIKDNSGNTALKMATQFKHTAIIDILRQAKAK
jgi:ankyrin repeat protein